MSNPKNKSKEPRQEKVRPADDFNEKYDGVQRKGKLVRRDRQERYRGNNRSRDWSKELD